MRVVYSSLGRSGVFSTVEIMLHMWFCIQLYAFNVVT